MNIKVKTKNAEIIYDQLEILSELSTLFSQEKNRIKNLKVNSSDIDIFVNKIKDIENENWDILYNSNVGLKDGLSFLWDADFNFSIESYDDVIDLFENKIFPIDYDDYDSTDYFMKNLKNYNEWVFINKSDNYIEEIEFGYKDWLEYSEKQIYEKVDELTKKFFQENKPKSGMKY